MKLRRYIFRLYWFGLRLYPKSFREAYGDEMLAVVYETLQIPGSSIDMLRLALRLIFDLCVTATKERIKQMTLLAKNKPQLDQAWPLQVLGMLVITYLVVQPVITMYTVMRHAPTAGSWYLELMTTAVPACMIVLAFMLLRQPPGLALWSRLKWAYLLGFGGGVAFVALSVIDRWIAPLMFPQVLHLWDGGVWVYTQGRAWVLAAVVGCILYLVTVKMRERLASAA
jgi:hypothetical protein